MVERRPYLFVFACHRRLPEEYRGLQTTEELAGAMVRIVSLPCCGKLEVKYLLHAFEQGADAVLVLCCPVDDCRLLEGNRRARARVGQSRSLLEQVGLGGERVDIRFVGDSAKEQLLREVERVKGVVARLGVSPLRRRSEGS